MRIGSLILALALSSWAASPVRIVSTAPSVTETLFALGAGGRVVGVTTYCHYPPAAMTRAKIGTYATPSVEAIAALRPDLVIVQRHQRQAGTTLERMRVPVLYANATDIASIHESITRIGAAAGVSGNADALNARIREQLDDLRRRAARLARRRVIFVVGRTPNTVEGLVAVGGKTSYLAEVLAIAGGDNIFAGAIAPYPKVSLEEILARNPEVIIDMGDMADTIGVTDEHRRAVTALWARYPSLSAVRAQRVYAVASDIFVVPGPRVVDAAREFFRMLHPEAAR